MAVREGLAEHRHGRNTLRALRLLGVLLLYRAEAYAIDIEPGIYTARAPGKNALGLYVQHVERNARYADGEKLSGDVTLDSNSLQMRFLHYLEYRGRTVAPGFIASCGVTRAGSDIAGLGTARGCADPIVGTVFWVRNRPQEKRYLAVTPYLSVPVGNYDKDRSLNLGENRWKIGVNSGVIMPLPGKFLLDLVGDVVGHSANDEYLGDHRLEQRVLVNAQIHLRYQIDPATRVSASYLHDWGGETSVDGIDQQNTKNQGRYRIGAARYLNPRHQLQLEVGADSHVENGFRESARFIVRYVWLD
ncbi:MAG: transporter [Gammaproteobacteria bacterium]|nr:transporter [Gammaproteobacteria bacterium]